ncbi:MAG: hypothetical protein AAF585_23145 [Verrucomicrobiota bacterium]
MRDHPMGVERWMVYDQQTQFRFQPPYRGSQVFRRTIENYYVLSWPLKIWHDTPITVMFDIAAGTPVHQAVSVNQRQESIELGHSNFVLHEALMGRYFDERESIGSRRVFAYDRGSDHLISMIYELAPDSLDNRTFYAWSEPPLEPFWRPMKPGLQVITKRNDHGANQTIDDSLGFQILHYPEEVRVSLTLPALPPMPNRRHETTDLMDVRLDFQPTRARNSHQRLSWVCDATQLRLDYPARPQLYYFDLLSEDETDSNMDTTPRQLLKDWEALNPHLRVIVDQANHQLIVREKTDWPQKIQEGWDWLRGKISG